MPWWQPQLPYPFRHLFEQALPCFALALLLFTAQVLPIHLQITALVVAYLTTGTMAPHVAKLVGHKVPDWLPVDSSSFGFLVVGLATYLVYAGTLATALYLLFPDSCVPSRLRRSKVGRGLPRYYGRAVYLDWNATTPIFPEVAEEMRPFLFRCFGNPASAHLYALPCRDAVVLARERVARLLGCHPDEVVFTSCGSEADNWAITSGIEAGRARLQQRRRALNGFVPHVVTCAIEHPAVLKPLETLRAQGKISLTVVPVDPEGLVDPEQVRKALTPATVLVTIMHSNNEVGSIQPIAEIAEVCRAHSIIFHSDAAQSIGKVVVDVRQLGVDLLTVVGHKFGAPKGIAALYVRQGLELVPLLRGGGQEAERRAGTENVMLIAGMGRAADVVHRELSQIHALMVARTDKLRADLIRRVGKDLVRFNGPSDPSKRLPNTVSVSFKGFSGSLLVACLSKCVGLSAGSACHSHEEVVSPVLQAMNVPEEYARGTLRISCGRHTTWYEVWVAALRISMWIKMIQQGKVDPDKIQHMDVCAVPSSLSLAMGPLARIGQALRTMVGC